MKISNNLDSKFEEIKKVGIIKDFKPIYKKGKLIDYNIEFYDNLPPEKALNKLDFYLTEKIGVII